MSTAPKDTFFRLVGLTPSGAGNEPEPIAARPLSPLTRGIGLAGDDLTIAVRGVDWPPPGTDVTRAGIFRLEFGAEGGEQVEMGGYVIDSVTPLTYGSRLSTPALVEPVEYAVSLVSMPGFWRDGRGGRVRIGTLNPVDADGVVQPLAINPERRDNSELIDLCLDALNWPYDGEALTAAAPSLDAVAPPGPLDWGNAAPLAELEAILARTAHAAALTSDGAKIRVFRLPRAGESVSVPPALAALAEPYTLIATPGVRAQNLVITSGTTRSLIITTRPLASFEWVWFDAATGRWLNDAQTLTLYPSSIKPGDIAAFIQGPPRDPAKREEYGRLFRALRLVGDDLEACRRVRPPATPVSIALPGGATAKLGAGVGAIALARSAVIASGVLRNLPAGDADPLVPLSGVTVHPGEGVFEFSAPLVRCSTGATGRLGDARVLASGDLLLLFAHEANTGDYATDYAAVGFRVNQDGYPERITDAAETLALMDEPSTSIVDAAFLVRALSQPTAADEPTPLNDPVIHSAAGALAQARVQAASAVRGTIEIRGLHQIDPGAWSGAVSRVTWDIARWRTIVDVNQHAAPDGEYQAIAAAAGESLVAGMSRFTFPGSSAGAANVASSSTGAASGESAAQAQRGGEAAKPGAGVVQPRSAPRSIDGERLLVRLGASTSLAAGRWSYAWTEVRLGATPGSFTDVAGGRSSATAGRAYSAGEAFNSGSGVQGNGVDLGNLPSGWTLRPLSPQSVVEIVGPFGAGSDPWWVIANAINAVDGTCSTGTADGAAGDGDCGCGGVDECGCVHAATGIDEAMGAALLMGGIV